MSQMPFSRSSRTVVVSEASSVRQMLCDAVRNLGFLDVTALASGLDALRYFEVDDCDWLIMPLMPAAEVNALQILRTVSQTPRLQRVRTSLLYEASEDVVLTAAFHYGLMSCHPRSYLRDDVITELKSLMQIGQANDGKTTLIAAEYLRRHLLKTKMFDVDLALEQSLLGLFPGSTGVLLKLGEAQLLNGKTKEGLMTLHQATLIDEGVKEHADKMAARLSNVKIGPGDRDGASQNILGVKTCVLVDPDSAVLNGIRELLQSVGVPRIEVFDDGDSAWEWLRANEEPDLILQEWRIPGLSGPMLLQRVRQHGFCRTPINVVSSVIKPKEVHLLREMGVDEVIAKPFGRQEFFKSIVWTIQQNVSPTERGSLERKVGRLLRAGQTEEAERLKAVFMADTRITTAPKRLMEAEFAFHYGKFREARDLGIEALRLAGDTLQVLNLVGKCLIKLGDHAAALRFFEKANALSPLNIEHLCNLAICQFDNGNAKAAAGAVAKAKALDGKSELVGQTECGLAILSGETAKAKSLMGQLASVGKILAYMNNRAVALSRCGRYDDGIKLYQQTVESLPGEWGDTHDIVAYNLGLAYTRYGDFPHACSQLEAVLKRPSAPLARKAQSLLSRIKNAEKQGAALTLYEAGPTDAEPERVDEQPADPKQEAASTGRPVTATLDIKRGDLCLYGIFNVASLDKTASQLLTKTPHFVERSAIERQENMTQINLSK
jgi:CheY-like chemotaxis protein